MRRIESGKYASETAIEELASVSAHLVDLGFKKGKLDPSDIEPEYDVSIDAELKNYEFQEGSDPYPVVDVINNSFLDEVHLDSSSGYFQFVTETGSTAEGWMPFLDEGKAEGVFCIEHPWSEEVQLTAYDGKESADSSPGVSQMLETAYMTAREHIPDKGQRNADQPMTELESNLEGFYSTIRKIESKNSKAELDGDQHAGAIRGRDIVSTFSRLMGRARKANLIDYPVSNEYGSTAFERTAGGYKNLTELPESAPYNSMEEAIEFRYPNSWLEKEQN